MRPALPSALKTNKNAGNSDWNVATIPFDPTLLKAIEDHSNQLSEDFDAQMAKLSAYLHQVRLSC
jgi:hypothetical protein